MGNPSQDVRGYDNQVSTSPRPSGPGNTAEAALDNGGRDHSFSSGYPSTPSRSSKPTASEPGIQGKVPRGYVLNEPQYQPPTTNFSAKRLKKGSVS